MHARVFSRIKHSSKRFAQIALFSTVIILILLGNVSPSFGQQGDPYDVYRTLFENSYKSPNNPNLPDRSGVTQSIAKERGTTGVSTFNVESWLVMDPGTDMVRAKGNYYQDKVAETPTGSIYDTNNAVYKETYVVRIGYQDTGGNQIYAVRPISSKYWDPSCINKEQVQIGYFFRSDTSALCSSIALTTIATALGATGIIAPGIGALAGFVAVSGSSNYAITHQNIRTAVTFKNPVPYDATGKEYTVDFWYCSESDGQDAPRGDRVEYFTSNGIYRDRNGQKTDGYKYSIDNSLAGKNADGNPNNLCGGTAFYKIGETKSFDIPDNESAAEQQATTTFNTQATSQSTDGGLPECGILSGSVLGCVAQIIYGLIYKPISFIAALFGYLFDFFIGYSVSDESYRFAFVNTGWQLVRDICNIFFIIILVWTGFATVFNIGGVSMKKVIPTLLINALAINFSLFGTRVIIDLSNVVARVFYNQLGVCTTKDCSPDLSTGKVEYKRGIGGYWPLSEKIVASFNPQTILSSSILSSRPIIENKGTNDASNTSTNFNSQTNTQNGTINANAFESGNGMSQSSSEYAGYFIIVTLIGAAIMVAVAMMFWGVAFMFLGRVIGLYVTMIFSPLAVLTRGNLPLIGKIPKLSWSDWSKELTSYAMLAPIFIFFLYIIYAFLQTDFMEAFGVTKGDRSFFENVLYIAIPMLIIYQLIKTGVGLAKQYAGSMGNMVQDGINGAVGGFGGVLGGGIGLAAGAVALAGRGGASIVGKVLNKTGATDAIAARAENNWGYRKLNQGIKWSQTSSMDVRDTKLNQKVGQGLGLLGAKPIDNISQKVGFGTFNLGQGTYKGGVQKIQKDRIEAEGKAIDKKLDFSHLSETQATDAWKRHTNKKVDQAWEKQTVENEVKNNTQLVTLKETETQIKSIMEQAAAAGDFKAVASQKAKLNDNKREQAVLLSGIEKAVKAKKKDGAHKDSDEYKKIEKEVLEQIKQEHGKVEDAKQFSEAMRAEYIKRQLEESLFLSGEVSEDVRGTGTIGGLTGILASGSMSSIGGGTALLANYIDSRQADKKAALQGKLEKYNKGKKEGAAKAATAARKKAQHDKDLQDAEATLRQAIAEKEQKNIEDITSLDDYSYEVQKDAIQQMTAKLNREKDESKETYEVALRNLKSAKNKTTVGGFAGGGGSTSPEEIAKLQKAVDDAAVIQQKAFDRHKDASEALKKREKATDNLYSLNKDSDAAKRQKEQDAQK